MSLYGRIITRQSLIYAVGLGAIVPFGLVSLAVTTRYLEPSEYGRLAVLFAVASVLTVLSGVGVLQGMMVTVFRIADGDDGDDTPVDITDLAPLTSEQSAAEKRRLLGSGLLLCAGAAFLVCGIPFLTARPLAGTFIGDGHTGAQLVRWMAISAFAGSMWRAVHQLYRLERRPYAWSALQMLRPALVVAGTIFALASGHGLLGILVATAGGTILATVCALGGTRKLVRFAPRRDDVSLIMRAGMPLVPIVIAKIVQSNINVLLLATLASPKTVGLYQAASRVSQIPGYFGSAFLLGWAPLERSTIGMAARDERGRPAHNAAVFTLFFLSLLGALALTTVGAAALIGIAGPGYGGAGPLIPVVATGVCAQLVFNGVYRATSFPRRRLWFVVLHFLWLAPYTLVAMLAIPVEANYGVAVAEIAAGCTVTWAFIVLDHRSGTPTPVPWLRLGGAVALAGIYALVMAILPVPWFVLIIIGAAGAWCLLRAFVLLDVVTRRQLRITRDIVRGAVWDQLRGRHLLTIVEALPAHERQAVVLLAWRKLSPEDAAAQAGVARPVLLARLARSLRHIKGRSTSTPLDEALGEYVLQRRTTLEHDELAHSLHASGANPLDLHLLGEVMRATERVRRRGLRRESSRAAASFSNGDEWRRQGVGCGAPRSN